MSFLLTSGLQIKKLKLLDIGEVEGDSGFDADVALFTGEVAPLLSALIEALDGEAPRQEQAHSTTQAPNTRANKRRRNDFAAEVIGELEKKLKQDGMDMHRDASGVYHITSKGGAT